MINVQPLSPPTIYQARTFLTNDIIRTLSTGPVLVVPASGPGLIAIVLSWVKVINIVTEYTSTTNAAWYLCYENGGSTASTIDNMESILAIASLTMFTGAGAPISDTLGITGYASALGGAAGFPINMSDGGILLRDDWAAGNYVGGGSDNSVIVNVLYYIFNFHTGFFL